MAKLLGTKLAGVLCVGAVTFGINNSVMADPIPEGWQAHNVEPIGFLDYQDRYAGKFTIKEQDGRWYLYTAVSKTQEGHGTYSFSFTKSYGCYRPN